MAGLGEPPHSGYSADVAGYTASAMLQGGAPRFAGWDAGAGRLAPTGTPWTESWSGEAVPIDLVGRPLDGRVADWLASIGQAWTQLTFFLFDPESWR